MIKFLFFLCVVIATSFLLFLTNVKTEVNKKDIDKDSLKVQSRLVTPGNYIKEKTNFRIKKQLPNLQDYSKIPFYSDKDDFVQKKILGAKKEEKTESLINDVLSKILLIEENRLNQFDIEKIRSAIRNILNQNPGNKELFTSSVNFSSSIVDIENGAINKESYFSEYAGEIFAFWNEQQRDNFDSGSVLAKWTNKDGEIILFDYIEINSKNDYNYIGISEKLWENGEYNLELYRINDDLEPFASGNFNIDSSILNYYSSVSFFGDYSTNPQHKFYPKETIRFEFKYRVDQGSPGAILLYDKNLIVYYYENIYFATGEDRNIYVELERFLDEGGYWVEVYDYRNNVIGRNFFEVAN